MHCELTTLDSGVNVAPEINVAPATIFKKY